MPALLAAAGAVIALILFGRVTTDALWANDLNNFAHGPASAVLALILMAMLRRGGIRTFKPAIEYPLAFAATLLLGAMAEVMQTAVGRHAGTGDLLRDALGAIAALGLLAVVDRRLSVLATARRWRILGGLMGLVAVSLLLAPLVISALAYRDRHRNFPVLADFERPFSTYFVAPPAEVSARRRALPAAMALQADRAFGLQIDPRDPRWWGVMLREPRPDWRGFERVKLTIANPATIPLRLRVRIVDRHHNYGDPPSVLAAITIAPESVGTAEVLLRPSPAADSRRPLDLENVKSLIVARAGKERTPAFYLLRVWLE